MREIAEAAGVSYEQAYNILHEELGMRKLSARRVPHLLTVDQESGRTLHDRVLNVSSGMKRIFYDVLLLMTKFVSNTTLLRQINNRNSGMQRKNRLRKRQKQFRQLAK